MDNFYLVVKNDKGQYLDSNNQWQYSRNHTWQYATATIAFADAQTFGGKVYLITCSREIELTKADVGRL